VSSGFKHRYGEWITFGLGLLAYAQVKGGFNAFFDITLAKKVILSENSSNSQGGLEV
jgi:hypothetical protein